MWLFDDVLGAVNGLYGAIVDVLMSILYPVVVVLGALQDIVNAGAAPVLRFVNVLISIPNIGIKIINLLFVGVFPSVWIGLLVATLLIVCGLRLYSIVNNIELLGFKL